LRQNAALDGKLHGECIRRLFSWQLEEMRTLTHPKLLVGQSCIDKVYIWSADTAVCPMDVPKDVQLWLYSLHSGKQFTASLMLITARILVKNSTGWTVGNKHVTKKCPDETMI